MIDIDNKDGLIKFTNLYHITEYVFTLFHKNVYCGCGQLVRAFASQAEGWVFKFQPRQTQVVKTGNDSSNAKLSAISVIVTGPRRWP